MKKRHLNPLFILTILVFAFFADFTYAKTDLSISEIDVAFSKQEILENDTIRVYARIFNTGDTDVFGFVVFKDNNKEMAANQAISVRANTYDDVFIDWKAKQGKHDIKVSVINLNPLDENAENDSVTKKDILVDLDTDNDSIGNEKDVDDDNDGLTDEEENKIGTDPQETDTDDDGVSDKIDAFPKEKSESRDTDLDGLGDNKDLDDDDDGIFDQDELFEYGTNALNFDSDSDGLGDKQEIESGTNPIKADTDSDGADDSQDKYPIDPTKWQASLKSATGFFGKNKVYVYLAIGALALLVLYFLFSRRRKRRR